MAELKDLFSRLVSGSPGSSAIALFPATVVVLSLFWAAPVIAEKPSPDSMVIYSYGPARVQVLDARGLRTGIDLDTGERLLEIPRSKVVVERARNRGPGWTIILDRPEPGEYRVLLAGTEKGGAVLDLDAVDRHGKVRNSHFFRRIREGETLTFTITFSPESSSGNRLTESPE
ncbi:MAG: hypothetical protein JSV00_01955 [bacterium]|nr:MAG: hypothetical protein JSV00_01955 [bacterium]